jgi:hypothetical protein
MQGKANKVAQADRWPLASSGLAFRSAQFN